MKTTTVSLDVRDDIRQGRDPFNRIMEQVAQLGPDQDLCVVAPFEPFPLQAVLGRQGFSHRGQATPSGDWKVTFHRQSQPPPPSAAPTPALPRTAPHPDFKKPLMVDARHLEPPQPLVAILEALVNLPAGQELVARTDRRPVHLHEQLEVRGFHGITSQLPDGSYVTHISHR